MNARDMNNRTPLFHAAKLNKVNAVRVLLLNFANVFCKSKDGTNIEETTDNNEILTMLAMGKSF